MSDLPTFKKFVQIFFSKKICRQQTLPTYDLTYVLNFAVFLGGHASLVGFACCLTSFNSLCLCALGSKSVPWSYKSFPKSSLSVHKAFIRVPISVSFKLFLCTLLAPCW